MSNLELILNLFKEDFSSLESFIDILPIGVYITSPSGKVLLINNYVVEKFEYPSKHEFMQLNLNSPNSDVNKQTRNLFLSILEQFNKVENFTFEYETYKDNLLYTKESALLLENSQTDEKYIIGTLEDITENVKQQELQIKTSNFISAINESLLILIQESDAIEAITNACNIVGKSIDLSSINLYLFDENSTSKKFNNLITWENDSFVHQYQIEQLPTEASEFIQNLTELFDYVELGNIYASNISECEAQVKEKFKKYKINSIIIAPIIYENNFIGFTVFIDNNSERDWKDYEINLLSLFSNSVGNTYKNHQKNTEILSLKTNLETIINASEAGLWDWDLTSNNVYINSNFAKHIGINPEINVIDANELISRFDEHDKEKLENALQAICCNKVPYFTFDFKIFIDNKLRWLNHYGKVLEWNEEGTAKRISGLLLDITERKLYEQTIKEQQDKIDILINSSELLFYELNKDGIFTFIQGTLLDKYNLGKNLLNKSYKEISDEFKSIKELIENAYKDIKITQSIPIGEYIIDFKIKINYDANNKIDSIFIIASNQTIENKYRLDIEKSNQQLYAILEAFPGPVNIIDLNYNVIDSNQVLLRGFNLKSNQFDNLQNFIVNLEKYTLFDKITVKQVLESYRPATRYTTEEENALLGAAFMINSVPVFDEEGHIWAVAQIGFDITELHSMQQKLNETIQTKDKFFDIIAHDLKNPIYSVSSQLDDLIQNYEMLSMNELFEINLQIQKSISILSQLLNNLLDWSRSQTNRVSYNPDFIDVSYLAENVYELYKETARLKNINLINEIHLGTTVWADSNMIFTVIRNLVSNAIKYTNSGGDVHIIAQDNNEYYTFSVVDNGIGMNPKIKDNLFKIESVQSTPGTNQEKGTGLGLILCKEFVERNKGKIWVETEFSKGSSFNFTIPKFPLND